MEGRSQERCVVSSRSAVPGMEGRRCWKVRGMCKQSGITLTAFECISEVGSVNRTPPPAAPGMVFLSAFESSLSPASKRKPHSLRSCGPFHSGHPRAGSLLPKMKSPIHVRGRGLRYCGGGGIRTHDTRKGMPVFKTGAFNQAPPPLRWLHQGSGRQIYAEQSSLSKEDVFKRRELRL